MVMCHVKQWISSFLRRHKARYGPPDWPNTESDDWLEFVKGWIQAFEECEVTEKEADEASLRLVRKPPKWRSEHVPQVTEMIMAIRKGPLAGITGISPGDIAKGASRHCQYCDGSGLATIWPVNPDAERRIPRTLATHCVCPYGQWMRKTLEDSDAATARRYPNFEAVLSGYDNRFTAEAPAGRNNESTIALDHE
jgi:hypothetical protein